MPLNPLGLYRIIVNGEIHGQLTQNLFHFKTHTGSTHTTYNVELQAIMTDFRNLVLPKIQLYASDDWVIKSVLGVTLIPRPGFLVEDRTPGLTGAQGDDALPSHNAGLLVFRSGVGGRSGHGRVYIPGPSALLCPNSRHSDSYLALLADIGSTLLGRFGATGSASIARFGIFSRKLGVTRNLGPPVTLSYNMAGFFTASSFIPRSEVATMRKRKLFRGQ